MILSVELGVSADSGMQRWYVFTLFLFAFLVCIHCFFFTIFPFQVWALEIELIVGISSVSDVRFPALARWGASRAWKRDLLRVHVHRERLNTISFDDVPV